MSIIPREKLLDYPDLYVVDEQPGSFMCGLKSLVVSILSSSEAPSADVSFWYLYLGL